MEPKLKEALIKKIELAQKDLAANPKLKGKLEGNGRLMSLGGDVQRPQNALLMLVRKKLLKERMWEPVEAELARMALADFVRAFERKQSAATSKVELSAARQRQLELFPGFETLPTRIRKGNSFLKFPETSVPEFLEYQATYQSRTVRSQRHAEELYRLALIVRPFAELELTVADAFKRANSQPPALALVPRVDQVS